MLNALTYTARWLNTARTRAMDTHNNNMDPAQWLDEHGDYLYRFAMKHLRDSAQAEDAVQETLLAALQAVDNFSGDSSPRTWLTGILKHKIIDIIRKQSRMTTQDDDNVFDQATDPGHMFDQRGHWLVAQAGWGNPESTLEQERFWLAFTTCLESLPPKLARIFSLRELSGLDTTELCEVMNITTSNCWVILHRARLALKQCLEAGWLDTATGEHH